MARLQNTSCPTKFIPLLYWTGVYLINNCIALKILSDHLLKLILADDRNIQVSGLLQLFRAHFVTGN